VRRVAESHVHPDTAVVVGVGDYAKVGDSLSKLSLGPVTLRDYDGNPSTATAAATPTK